MTDYKTTVFLPRTPFPMKADLPKKEPAILAEWQQRDLYNTLANTHAGKEKYVLHDGPPYANGHLHIGHALNKILKDIICRYQRQAGKHVAYIPGWDCHGLPIEWKIEEEYRAKKQNKNDVPLNEFREQCRSYAARWIDVQCTEFKRLGVDGLWDAPYKTMDFKAEAAIVQELHTLLEKGYLYQGFKPVMWSVVEETALAEAEVEYLEKESTEVYVKFPVVTGDPALKNASIVIWTTTPWTLPANAAVACNPEINYVVLQTEQHGKLLIAESLVENFSSKTGITGEIIKNIIGFDIIKPSIVCLAPFDFDTNHIGNNGRMILPANFVTEDQGTGFVHIAPAHGEDDFSLQSIIGNFPQIVNKNGIYKSNVPDFAGMHIFKESTTQVILNGLGDKLLYSNKFRHSYPHSWRSKKPLIYLATPQWFIAMEWEENYLRNVALKETAATTFYPPAGKNRLSSMIEKRPDWCISRQRAWGVPIMLLRHKETGEPLNDCAILQKIQQKVANEGCDWWFEPTAVASILQNTTYAPAEYETVKDILDVWFDSGCTHSFVLENPIKSVWHDKVQWPADLYLEGSDQHRGWFQSSLLASVGTRGKPPFKNILTHGFVLDESGRKMSKSLGNVVAPQEVIEKYGADVLRLWVVLSDFYDDLRIGKTILEQTAELYRRLRNTLRYLLGALSDFSAAEYVENSKDMPETEQYMLHLIAEMQQEYEKIAENYTYSRFYTKLHQFCDADLSRFYVDIRKDSLYCDAPDSMKRRSVRTVQYHLLRHMLQWLAPVLCFTTEEAFSHAKNIFLSPAEKTADSVHLLPRPVLPALAIDTVKLSQKWQSLRAIRSVVLGALEKERAAKTIGSSLEATPVVYSEDTTLDAALLAELCITSHLQLKPLSAAPHDAFRLENVKNIAVEVKKATGNKCARCWKIEESVGTITAHPALCHRCAEVVG